MINISVFPSFVCVCVFIHLQHKHCPLLLPRHLSSVSGLRIQHSQERPRHSSDAITHTSPPLPTPLAFHLMNHSVVRFGGGGDVLVMPAMAASKPPVPLSLKSHRVVGSVTSTIKQEALCGEKQPLWEQREGGTEETRRKKIGDVGECLQTWTTDQDLLLAPRETLYLCCLSNHG